MSRAFIPFILEFYYYLNEAKQKYIPYNEHPEIIK